MSTALFCSAGIGHISSANFQYKVDGPNYCLQYLKHFSFMLPISSKLAQKQHPHIFLSWFLSRRGNNEVWSILWLWNEGFCFVILNIRVYCIDTSIKFLPKMTRTKFMKIVFFVIKYKTRLVNIVFLNFLFYFSFNTVFNLTEKTEEFFRIFYYKTLFCPKVTIFIES